MAVTTHSNQVAPSAIHPAAYVQATDPGAVGANKQWVDTSTTAPYQVKVRNASNTAWLLVGVASSGVTSIAVAVPAELSVSGSPVTGAGTITIGKNQSATAAAIASGGTITTSGVFEARVAPAGAVTGVVMQAGTYGGQVCEVVNEAVAANTVTFAASGTSGVANGTGCVVAGLTKLSFVWDSITALWYPDQSSGGGAGTVTSVGISVPSGMVVANSPITSAGTIAITDTVQSPNTVKAGPASGGVAIPTFRALTPPDIPVMGASGVNHWQGAVPDPGDVAGTTRFLREDATFAVPAGGGGGGTTTNLIAETVLSASAATVSFPSIPTGYRDLRIIALARCDNAVQQAMNMQFNGDSTTAHYTPFNSATGNGGRISVVPGTSTTQVASGGFMTVEILVPDYANAVSAVKSATSVATMRADNTLEGDGLIWTAASAQAITSIIFSLAAGNFIAGTEFRIYGEPPANAPQTGSPVVGSLSADVTMSVANTFVDGPSVTVGPGTWLLFGQVTVQHPTSFGFVTAKLWDGTTVLDSGETTPAANGYPGEIALSATVSPTATTTYKISTASPTTGFLIKAATVHNGVGNNASTLVAIPVGNATRTVVVPSGMVPIQTQTVLGSVAASVIFNNIPTTYKNLRVTWVARGDTAAANAQVLLRFNGDSGTNYDAVRYDNSAGANDANNGAFGTTSGFCGYMSAASDAAGVAGSGQIHFPTPADPTFQRMWEALSFSGGTSPATSAASFLNILMGKWRNTVDAITSITFLPSAGNFAIGSTFTLWGESDTVAGNAGGSGTPITGALGADITVTPVNTFVDGPSVTVGPGTWELNGTVSIFSSTASAPGITAKLWDGTNVIAATQINEGTTSTTGSMSLSGTVSPTVTTTYKISVASSVVSTVTIKAATNNNPSGNNASNLVATPVFGYSQSATAVATATGGTIATSGVTTSRVSPAGAITGAILQAGTYAGQRIVVINEAVAANTVTFAVAATSNVADGTSDVIAGLNARMFAWDTGTALWYPCK